MKHQEMTVTVLGQDFLVTTDGFVEFKSFTIAGNRIRALNGKSIMNMDKYLSSNDVADFVGSLIKKYGGATENYITVTGKGKNARRMVCLQLAIKLAMNMDSDFELEIIDSFINSRLIEYRLDGGDQFKFLNAAIDRYLPDSKGIGMNRGKYINAAKIIKARCDVPTPDDADKQTWNQGQADAIAQKRRYEIERSLTQMLELGVVRSWEHLKELAEKV